MALNLQQNQIRVPKTAELVAAQLRRKIIRGELKEGDNLPAESALIEELGVSRPTMREAFRILEVENLITVSRGSRGGATVHLPNVDVVARYAGHYLQSRNTSIADIYEARLIIEPHAVYLMARRQPRDKIEEVRELIQLAEEHLEDSEAYSHYSAQLHLKLIAGSGNETLTLVAHVLAAIVDAVLLKATGQRYDIDLAKKGLRSHQKALQLIEAGEAEKVETHMRQQIQAAREVLLKNDTETIVDLIS